MKSVLPPDAPIAEADENLEGSSNLIDRNIDNPFNLLTKYE